MPSDAAAPVVRRADALAAAVDDELVLLPASLRHYVMLNPVGRRIWELLETPHSPASLAETLAREFVASTEQILSDTQPFLDELRREGLIEPATSSP
jgi:Coenzyme PQQ synthesis protein D (PqqD)